MRSKKWYLCIGKDEVVVRPYKLKKVVTSVTQKEVAEATGGYGNEWHQVDFPVLPTNQYRAVLDYFLYVRKLVYITPSDECRLTDKGLDLYWSNHTKEVA